jgi:hypothetical protein
MSIEDKLRLELHNQAQSMKVPDELEQRVRQSYEWYRRQKEETVWKRTKWLPAAVIAAVLLLPTGVLAYNFADSIFGSFEKMKKKISIMTMEQYQKIGLKLSGAHKALGDAEYVKFEELLKTYIAVTYDYVDQYGHVNFDQMPADKRAEAKQLLAELTPYYDKLNNTKSSKEVLTPEEFDKYIEAEMTINTVKAIAGIKDGPDIKPEDFPGDLRGRYVEANKILKEVYKKIARDDSGAAK